MMMYKASLLYALLLSFGHTVYSQVGIGTTTPNSDAMLDVTSTNKGILLPRVALITTTSPSPLSANVAGMMVYNTATAGSGSTAVSPGLYVNDGTQWRTVSLSGAVFTCGTSTVTFTYRGASVTYGTIASPTTGVCFLDRNLGASQAATAYNDYLGYGDLFQWGRLDDGHQLITWTNSTTGTAVNGTTTTLSSGDIPGNSLFIRSATAPNDWRNPQNNALWQGASGTNNPCPAGWFVPAQADWAAESEITNNSTAYSSLKLTAAGYRDYSSGNTGGPGTGGQYWSSTVSGTSANNLSYGTNSANPGNSSVRAFGLSVRCRK